MTDTTPCSVDGLADDRAQMLQDFMEQYYARSLRASEWDAIVAFLDSRLALTPQPAPAATQDTDALREALEPFAKAWEEAQAYADFDGRDCREVYLANAGTMEEYERAFTALSKEAERG